MSLFAAFLMFYNHVKYVCVVIALIRFVPVPCGKQNIGERLLEDTHMEPVQKGYSWIRVGYFQRRRERVIVYMEIS